MMPMRFIPANPSVEPKTYVKLMDMKLQLNADFSFVCLYLFTPPGRLAPPYSMLSLKRAYNSVRRKMVH